MSAEWVSRAEAAEELQVKLPRIYQLENEQRLLANADGLISKISITEELERRQGKKTTAIKWKRIAEKYKAKNAKFKHEIQTGKYLLASEVQRDLGIAVDTTRQRILEIPTALAPSLIGISDPEVIREKLDTALRGGLESVAQKLKDYECNQQSS